MPNDAGTFVTATPSFVRVGFSFIDANGGLDSASWITTVARATDAAINNLATAIGDASNASLYEIRKELVQAAGNPSSDNATDATRVSVKDHVITLFRNPTTRQTQDGVIPAPIEGLFLETTNDIDVTNVAYIAVEDGIEALLEAAYGVVSVRFNETKKINKKTRR